MYNRVANLQFFDLSSDKNSVIAHKSPGTIDSIYSDRNYGFIWLTIMLKEATTVASSA